MSSSPWGQIDNVEKVILGVSWVSTSGHGGLRVAKSWAENNLTKQAISYAIDGYGYYWFEEDELWALVAFENQNLFPQYTQEQLVEMLNYYRQKYLFDRKLFHLIDKARLDANIEWEEKLAGPCFHRLEELLFIKEALATKQPQIDNVIELQLIYNSQPNYQQLIFCGV